MTELIDNPRSGVQPNPQSLEESVNMYLRAASFFPDDEPEKQVR
jgi:hypothetical protein